MEIKSFIVLIIFVIIFLIILVATAVLWVKFSSTFFYQDMTSPKINNMVNKEKSKLPEIVDDDVVLNPESEKTLDINLLEEMKFMNSLETELENNKKLLTELNEKNQIHENNIKKIGKVVQQIIVKLNNKKEKIKEEEEESTSETFEKIEILSNKEIDLLNV